MNKRFINSIFATTLACLCLTSGAAFADNPTSQDTQSYEEGLSANEFRYLATSLPKLPGRIEAIWLFHEPGYGENSVAIAVYGKTSGWRLLIYEPTNDNKFVLEWNSGKLDDTFSVASPAALRTFWLEGEQAITFNGCAPHVCPNVFSFLLYVPSKQTAFTARSTWGKATYSAGLEKPENIEYKSVLDQLIKKHLKDIDITSPKIPDPPPPH